MKQILCLSCEPWSSRLPGRTQQLVSRLRDTQILYFSPARGPKDRSYRQRGKQVRPNVTAYTLPPISFSVPEQFHLLFRRSWNKIGRYIQDTAHHRHFSEPLLWTTQPRHIHLLDQLEYSGLVYDCDRVWDDTPPDWEGSLAQAADVVFAASPQLADRLSPCSSNIALMPNGLNLPLFDPSAPHFDPMPGVTAPILGWSGTIRAELDLSPVLYAAQARPDWGFLLMGPVEEGNPFLQPLDQLSNVFLPGPRPAAEVSDWLYRCDVLLDLLRVDRPYDDVVSPRLYEYLATGKPVVSMLWPGQVECFPDVVYNASGPEEFVTLCARDRLPMVWIQDTTGIDVGDDAEVAELLGLGQSLIYSIQSSGLPMMEITLRRGTAAAHYVLGGPQGNDNNAFSLGTAATEINVMNGKTAANAMYTGRLAKDQKAGKDLQPTIDKMNALIDDYNVKSQPLFCAQAGLVDEVVDMPMMRNYIVAFADSCYQNPASICPFHQMLLPRTIKDYEDGHK